MSKLSNNVQKDLSTVSLGLTYIAWKQNEESEQKHIGVLTLEDDDSVTILTKKGEMTFMKNDGIFEDSNREEFEQVVVEIEKPHTENVSKKGQARLIFNEMYEKEGIARKDIIARFMKEINISKEHAATYHQSLKTEYLAKK